MRELAPGAQAVGRFAVTARAQPLHWAPTAGIRVGDEVALVTDTAYDADSAEFARGVTHLLHEAWSSSANPVAQAGDATAAEAGLVARAARRPAPHTRAHQPAARPPRATCSRTPGGTSRARGSGAMASRSQLARAGE